MDGTHLTEAGQQIIADYYYSLLVAPSTPDDRLAIEFLYAGQGIGRPFVAPPDMPADRLKALRDAFKATMKDGEFLAEAARVGLDVDPATAEEVEELLKRFAAYPPEILHKAQDAMGR